MAKSELLFTGCLYNALFMGITEAIIRIFKDLILLAKSDIENLGFIEKI